MSLTPEERLLLEAATARIEARRAGAVHEALRAKGQRPNVSLRDYEAGRLAKQLGDERARVHLTLAFSAGLAHDQRLEAARVAVASLPHHLAQFAERGPKSFRRASQRALSDVARAVRDCLEARKVGPRCARGTAASYVQQEDLEDLVPDGWGRSWPIEIARLGRRAGVPPLAVPLLNLLTWCSTLRARTPGARSSGAGFQVSLEWLSRKLGCSRSWVKVLWNRLDPYSSWRRDTATLKRKNALRRRQGKPPLALPTKPTGTAYVHRFRRLLKYSDVPKRDGQRADCWLDRTGRIRHWVDVRGVLYVTDAGRRLLVRRKSALSVPRVRVVGGELQRLQGAPLELRPNGTLLDLSQRLAPVQLTVTRRLAVSKPVENSDWKSTAPPSDAPARGEKWPPNYRHQ